MAGTGTATLDFGAFPGKSDASIAVTGQGGIVSGSLVEAWIRPVATADHTDTEHMVETLKVFAADIIAGAGFTIYGFNTNQVNEPLIPVKGRTFSGAVTSAQVNPSLHQMPTRGGTGTRIYGQWTIAWAWS